MALPSQPHLGEHHDHQLDSQWSPSLRVQAWTRHPPARMLPQQHPRPEKAGAHQERFYASMDRPAATGSSHPTPPKEDAGRREASPDSGRSGDREKSRSGGGKKKNYQRYPKPPYSYLAMIAMVIQRSAEKKLTLSEVRVDFGACGGETIRDEPCGVFTHTNYFCPSPPTHHNFTFSPIRRCFTRHLSKRGYLEAFWGQSKMLKSSVHAVTLSSSAGHPPRPPI